MKDELAEKLLVTVMGWNGPEAGSERAVIQDLARYKYDEYQQFAPGMGFVESLARWLYQFSQAEERQAAYQFVKEKMIFCSSAEIQHLVAMAYHDRVRPHLIKSTAIENDFDSRQVAKIVNSMEFRVRQRQTLFLGLSDGARIDIFRRANSPNLNHEQISRSHELSDARVADLLEELNSDLIAIAGDDAPPDPKFRTLVLLDDFSASGLSYYMPKVDKPVGGKLGSFFRAVSDPDNALHKLFDLAHTDLYIVLYVATEQAKTYIEKMNDEVWGGDVSATRLEIVQPLPEVYRMSNGECGDLNGVIDTYYDDVIHDRHMQKGRTVDGKFGFAACGLPLVMHHNTPNNSIALLWSYEDTKVRGLFPRVRRHRA